MATQSKAVRQPGKARLKVLAVASGGGHVQELLLIMSAFDHCDVIYACTDPKQVENAGKTVGFALRDYNRDQPMDLLRGLQETWRLVRQTRPDWVISTGAAPGLLTLLWGRVLGARTMWVDSIANAERLSLSGRIALRVSHITLTQWEHLAAQGGARYWGSVI